MNSSRVVLAVILMSGSFLSGKKPKWSDSTSIEVALDRSEKEEEREFYMEDSSVAVGTPKSPACDFLFTVNALYALREKREAGKEESSDSSLSEKD